MNAPVQCVRKKGKTISVSDDFISAVKKICNLRKAELLPDDSFFELFIGSDILDSMETSDSQIIWGRRGTGKTHLLKAFTQKVNFDPNSPVNTFRAALGMNKQGTIQSKVSMFANPYPFPFVLTCRTLQFSHKYNQPRYPKPKCSSVTSNNA